MSCLHCTERFCVNRVPLFSIFSCEELGEVFEVIEHSKLSKGKTLFQEGEVAKTLYIISKGRLKLYQYTKDGKEQIINILKPGDSFGELQILKESTFELYAKAIVDCEICMLRKEDFKRLLLQKPKMCWKVIELLGDRLLHTEKLAVMLADNNSDARLAYILIHLAEEYGSSEEGRIQLELPISKEDLANYTGLTRETVSRKLSVWKEQGLIRMKEPKKIELLDVSSLQNMI